jgi:hypothetical protein
MDPSNKEYQIVVADYLTGLADKIRNGEVVLTNLEQKRNYERWWNNEKWEHFCTRNNSVTLEYYDVEGRKYEMGRKELYLKANPKALENGYPAAIVSLNGVPRGLCNDFNVEEGWVQYVTPKSGNHDDYSNKEAAMEIRRYFGNVRVLGYLRESGPDPDLKDIYNGLEKDTPLIPTEAYEVVEELPPIPKFLQRQPRTE